MIVSNRFFAFKPQKVTPHLRHFLELTMQIVHPNVTIALLILKDKLEDVTF